MKNIVKPLLITTLLIISSLSHAATTPNYDDLRAKLSRFFPGAELTGFKDLGIANIVEFNIGAQVLYTSKDGRFLFKGNVFDLVTQENLTEQSQQVSRLSALGELGEENMLVYKPKEQKSFITVFTDVDCYYCRKLHEEIDQYMEKGIAVRYLFRPLKGKKSFDKSVGVWCSKNPQEAMTNAKNGRRIQTGKCENPIAKQMALGDDFGINGTPAIILQNGKMIPGYRPVADIAKLLNGENI